MGNSIAYAVNSGDINFTKRLIDEGCNVNHMVRLHYYLQFVIMIMNC